MNDDHGSAPPRAQGDDGRDPRAAAEAVASLIHARRNRLPRHLVAPGPTADELEALVAAAAAAPDHGEIGPWRFIVIDEPARARLGEVFRLALLERDPGADARRQQDARAKADEAPCLLLAVVDLGGAGNAGDAADHDHIPPAERLVSLGCALQNMLLLATAMGHGSGLASGRTLASPALRQAFGLGPTEQAVCFAAFGTPARTRASRPRRTVAAVLGRTVAE